MKNYGKELILDIHHCDSTTFNRTSIRNYFKELCNLIDMKRCELYWWDDYRVPPEERQTEPHMKGTSAIQFISTSNITIHTLELLGNVYLNIFSFKEFDPDLVLNFSEKWFKGKTINSQVIKRV
ncbi:MAG: S-adenosylmethionine decarboxylase [Candidatus Thermoplasmatota archaeon]|nr:S-adenosylmethionine decarboxylase [Candidatus Thermoplasmatota archaeon]